MFASRRGLLGLSLTAIAGFTGLALSSAPSLATSAPVSMQRLEVAMDGSKFFFEGDTNQNGVPANGTPFVIQGYIYPEGTFAQYGELSGVLPQGGPEFPDDVIGTWICRGWHLQDGDAQSGPVVATTQIFDLDPEHPGRHTIVSDGIELAGFGVPFERAITGGTGMFSGISGQHRQIYVGDGLNASGGFNTKFGF